VFLVAAASAVLLGRAAGQEVPTIRVRPPADERVRQIERAPAHQPQPNLQPSRVHFRAAASSAIVEVCVDVANAGNADSTPTTVSLSVVVSNPSTLGAVGSQTLQLPLGVVRPNARPTELCGGYTVPNRSQDWDLHANAHVDPNNAVAEANETDNQRWRDCRLLSPNPGVYRSQVASC